MRFKASAASTKTTFLKHIERRSGRSVTACLVAGDVIALTGAVVGASLLLQRYDYFRFFGQESSFGDMPQQLRFYLAFVAVIIATFWASGHYSMRRPYWDELATITKSLLLLGCVVAAILFLGEWRVSRSGLLMAWALALVFVPVMRLQLKRTLLHVGWWARPCVIIGTGKNARAAARAVRNEPLLGFEIIGFLEPPVDWLPRGVDIASAPEAGPPGDDAVVVLQKGTGLCEALERLGRPAVIVALDTALYSEVSRFLHGTGLTYSTVNIVPPISGLPVLGMEAVHFFKHDVMMIQTRNNLMRKMPQRMKRMFDVAFSACALVALSPLFAYIAYRLHGSGQQVLFKHRRVGQNGRPFTCYKFQTMVPNSEQVLQNLLRTDPQARQEWERTFKLKNDPRITPFGDFLRKTSLDELPQLWNVLRGEMSLVGPRPIIETELPRYGENVGYYMECKPGMTGLWQVSGRNNLAYQERVALDVWYAKNWVVWYDVVILLKTVKVIWMREGAH